MGVKEKMTLEQFIRNNAHLQSNMVKGMLERVYKLITEDEIILEKQTILALEEKPAQKEATHYQMVFPTGCAFRNSPQLGDRSVGIPGVKHGQIVQIKHKTDHWVQVKSGHWLPTRLAVLQAVDPPRKRGRKWVVGDKVLLNSTTFALQPKGRADPKNPTNIECRLAKIVQRQKRAGFWTVKLKGGESLTVNTRDFVESGDSRSQNIDIRDPNHVRLRIEGGSVWIGDALDEELAEELPVNAILLSIDGKPLVGMSPEFIVSKFKGSKPPIRISFRVWKYFRVINTTQIRYRASKNLEDRVVKTASVLDMGPQYHQIMEAWRVEGSWVQLRNQYWLPMFVPVLRPMEF